MGGKKGNENENERGDGEREKEYGDGEGEGEGENRKIVWRWEEIEVRPQVEKPIGGIAGGKEFMNESRRTGIHWMEIS